MTITTENLEQGFAQFVLAARELEASYAALKLRAEAVDLELQQSNRALALALEEREAMFSALPIGLVALREDGAIGACNREAERLLGAATAAGESLLERRAGEVGFGDYVVRVRRVDLEAGELLLLEDRSRLQELEAEVVRLDRLAGLSELAFGVAHEIKNPLSGVLGFASLLERSDDPVAMKRYARKIVEGARDVDGIVKAMLGFARPVDKPVQVASIASIVERCATAVGLPRARCRVRGELGASVDAEALERVVCNLLQNAIEASADVTVDVTATVVRGCLELLVVDDGPGVPQSVADRVFEPFVSSKERGTGLGLALSMRVLSFLGGSLELLDSTTGGARFRVRVPLAVEPADAAQASCEHAGEEADA